MEKKSGGAANLPDAETLQAKSAELRAACIKMAHSGKEGHLNGALSSVDILVALYYGFLRIDPRNPRDPERDRLLFSKGHACTSLYAVMAERGFFPKKWLQQYAADDSPLPSHPCKHALPVLEVSAGSLGHGLGVGTGIAYALKLRASKARVVVLVSDGECEEGSTWEAALFGAAHKLENLLVIVDYNGTQSVGRSPELLGSPEALRDKFASFGWGAGLVDGHNMAHVLKALESYPFAQGKPSALVARTVAGKGVSFMEDQILWHYRVPSDEDLSRALLELKQTQGD